MPGLIRGVARTAAIAGTATAVSNGVSRRQANRWAEKSAAQQQPPPHPRLPRRPAPARTRAGARCRTCRSERRGHAGATRQARPAPRRRGADGGGVRAAEGAHPGRLTNSGDACMRIAIAGGHGQIALILSRVLTQRGHAVLGIMRNPDHAADVAATGAQPLVLDLEQAALGRPRGCTGRRRCPGIRGRRRPGLRRAAQVHRRSGGLRPVRSGGARADVRVPADQRNGHRPSPAGRSRLLALPARQGGR